MKTLRDLDDLELAGLHAVLVEAWVAAASIPLAPRTLGSAAQNVAKEVVARRAGRAGPLVLFDHPIQLIELGKVRELLAFSVEQLAEKGFDAASQFLSNRIREIQVDMQRDGSPYGSDAVETRTLQ